MTGFVDGEGFGLGRSFGASLDALLGIGSSASQGRFFVGRSRSFFFGALDSVTARSSSSPIVVRRFMAMGRYRDVRKVLFFQRFSATTGWSCLVSVSSRGSSVGGSVLQFGPSSSGGGGVGGGVLQAFLQLWA